MHNFSLDPRSAYTERAPKRGGRGGGCPVYPFISLYVLSPLLSLFAWTPSRARARRREIRPRKRTKGGDKGKRRPRDTRTMVAEQWADAGNLTDDRKCPVPFLRLPRLRSIIIMIIIITTTMLSFVLSLLFLSGQELISPRELIGLGMNACLSRLLKDARGKGRIYHALPPFYYFRRKHRIRFPYGEFSITMSFSFFSLLFSGGFFCGI